MTSDTLRHTATAEATIAIERLLHIAPDEAIGLWYRLANELTAAQAALTVDGPDLVCPHCDHHHFEGRYLQGRSWDTSFVHVQFWDGALRLEESDMSPAFEPLYYECAECHKGVRLPADVDVDWV